MNTIGSKMNNKLKNVMGVKFSNKIHSMGHKLAPDLNTSNIEYGQPVSNQLFKSGIGLNMSNLQFLPILKDKMKNGFLEKKMKKKK